MLNFFNKNSEIEFLKNKLVEAERDRDAALAEKENHTVRVNKQKYASDLVNKSIESTIMRKGSGIGYKEVAPPAKSAFSPQGKELSFISELNIEKPIGESSTCVLETPKVEDIKFSDAPIIEDWYSDSDEEQEKVELEQSVEKEEIHAKVEPKIEQVKYVKPVLRQGISRKMVEYKEISRERMNGFNNKPRGNHRNLIT